MSTCPLVSAIIPAYNSAKTLGRAIDSVLEQTYPNIELIVVNDGSTDDTEGVARSYPEVRFFSQWNEGPASARNLGARHARGEYLALLDDDDEWLRNKIERQMGVLARDSRVAALGARKVLVVVDSAGNELSRRVDHRVDGRLEEVFFTRLMRGNRIPLSSVVLRQATFEEMGGFDLSIPPCTDRDLWLRMAASGKRLFNLGEVLYVRYQRPEGHGRRLQEVVPANRLILQKWNPSANPASPLSAEEFAVAKQLWLLKDALRLFRRAEWTWGSSLVEEASGIQAHSALQNGLVRLARFSPRLFLAMAKVRRHLRYSR